MYRLHWVINGLLAVLLLPSLLLAQANVGVTGVVEDESKAAIPGAKVTLLGQETRAVQSTTSKSDGTFIFEEVFAASYVLKVEMSGFETYEKVLTVGTQPLKPLRIRLRVRALEEDVTVEAESTDRLSTSVSDAATTRVDDAWLRDLPIASDDVLAVIGRFISPAAQGAQGVSIVVDGVEGEQIDLPSSAISKITIDRNPYSPVFQHPGKARVEVTTKRGHRSRRVDGAFDMSERNSVFAARNAFAKASR